MESDKLTLLRHRSSKFNKIKELDIFPKLDEVYKETSPVGGFVSVICFGIIFWLVYSEIDYYLYSKLIFQFSPDTDFNARLKIHVDITVATPCNNLGADVVDATSQQTLNFGLLHEEDTWFELAPNQRDHFKSKNMMNNYLREEYHAIQGILWRRGFPAMYSEMPERNDKPKKPHDACRIHGTLVINKVAGIFHITAGRTLELPRGHLHLTMFDTGHNFSHRINRFSIGNPSAGIVHPLEGDEVLSEYSSTMYQYFIAIVPTNVQTYLTNMDTFQYSVKSLVREVNHEKGSHGIPGIYFKYDTSALKVTVRQERDHLGIFLARLCSIVGGVYVCSGFINAFLQFLTDVIMCNRKFEKKRKAELKSNTVFQEVPNLESKKLQVY